MLNQHFDFDQTTFASNYISSVKEIWTFILKKKRKWIFLKEGDFIRLFKNKQYDSLSLHWIQKCEKCTIPTLLRITQFPHLNLLGEYQNY